MIDGIKLFFIATEDEIRNLKSFIDFTSKVVIDTGDIIGTTEVGYYRNLKFTLRKGFALTIQGSLHKAFNNGINHNRFYYSDCLEAIQSLCAELGIAAERLKVQRVEFGVNVYEPDISFDTIENNLLLHKLTPFKPYVRRNRNIGFVCEHQRYALKIYDKSLQENLEEATLRLEYKVQNIQHLKSIGIKTLLDLTDRDKLQRICAKICKDFSYILMDNCEGVEKCDLTIKEYPFYYKARNVRYWKRLVEKYSLSTYTSHRRRFKKLVYKYTHQDLAVSISEMFFENWQKLLSY